MARTERIFKRIVQHRRSHVEDIALFPATPILAFRKRIFRYWWGLRRLRSRDHLERNDHDQRISLEVGEIGPGWRRGTILNRTRQRTAMHRR